MKGLSPMKRTASTSSSIFAVSSAITFLSANPAAVMSGQSLLVKPVVTANITWGRPRERGAHNHREIEEIVGRATSKQHSIRVPTFAGTTDNGSVCCYQALLRFCA